MKTLGEVFNPYLADKPLADDISSAELLKLNINSNNRSITMTAKFGGLVLRDNLFVAEKQISKSELISALSELIRFMILNFFQQVIFLSCIRRLSVIFRVLTAHLTTHLLPMRKVICKSHLITAAKAF